MEKVLSILTKTIIGYTVLDIFLDIFFNNEKVNKVRNKIKTFLLYFLCFTAIVAYCL